MTADAPSQALTAAAQKAFAQGFDAVIELAPENGSHLWVDGRKSPPAIASSAPEQIDCIWRGAEETLLRVLQGERALESAYLSGRLSVSGDMSVMARLALEQKR